ncbi:MAG: OmcA/MtrC family decaheme c-type cytochrome [Deltaproteobacteria bacterium]|nr:OmcA/MtrC family decaheme c-type cytochrome [Deltaproteobacteria bacterium]
MKTTRTLGLLLALALAAPLGTGCKGDAGADGLQGPAGASGATGSTGGIGATGATGVAGGTTLVKTTAEPAGANCAEGGFMIEVGIDENENGVLDASEVNAALTTYACNGDTGQTGVQMLVKTSSEAAGANCPFGGVKIEVGPDTNGNGVLDTAEVDANLTTYACNGQAGPSSASAGLVVAVKSVTTTGTPAVRFTLKDSRGFPVDKAGVYTVNNPVSMRFSISYITKDTATPPNVLPYNVLTTYNSTSAPTVFRPTAYNPDPVTGTSTKTPAVGTLVENGVGAGDYTYTFPAADVAQTNLSGTPNGVLYKAVAYDSGHLDDTHTIWIEATRQTNVVTTTDPKTFTAVNLEHNFIPSGTGTPVGREVASTDGCNKCHRGFTAEGNTSTGGFHGSGRIDANYCDVCHNPARTSNPAADAMVFVHRIHRGELLQPANIFHAIEATYPQDIRNCDACHKGAAQGGQAQSRPTIKACGSCHDYVDFATTTPPVCASPRAMTAVTTVTGTASAAGTTSVLTDSTQTWTANQFARGTLTMTSGVNNGFKCAVKSNTATAITCHGELPFAIASGDAYSVSSRDDLPAPCRHTGGVKADGTCTGCHSADDIKGYHKPVAEPDPNNVWVGGTNSNTNAAWLAAAGYVPTGADVITYAIDSVTLVDASPSSPNYKNPQIKFKFKRNGTDVVFQTYQAGVTTEMMPGFVGAPSVYFVWAEPQDGIAAPVDWNASASTYVKKVWNGATATTTATWTDKDANGFYTITLTGTKVPTGATSIYGGVGYTYSLGSAPTFSTATQPLTQINLTDYPYTSIADGRGTGGLIVPAADVYKVATGSNARRTIVDNVKCLTCHVTLGAAPTFHAGQRNDGPTCAFCHTPNRTSSAWSANSKDFIHAIHGARKRSVDFTWHAVDPAGYSEVEFPGPINSCSACHVSGGYDFSGSGVLDSIPNMLASTVATGRFRGLPSQSSSYYAISPYVDGTNATDYGFGYATSDVTRTHPTGNDGTQGGNPCSIAAPCTCTTTAPCTTTLTTTRVVKINNVVTDCSGGCTCTTGSTTQCSETFKTCTTNAPCEADSTTLVKSPIVSACSACHDTPLALSHMDMNGGSFYETRAAAAGKIEQCMLCHGPGKVAAIADVHQ